MSQVHGKRERMFTVFFMFCVTFVFGSAVSLAHLITQDTIARNETLFLKRAVLAAAGQRVPDDPQEIEELFRTSVVESGKKGTDVTYFSIVDPDSKAVVGYVFLEKGAGLWGTIVALAGFESDLRTMKAVEFLRHNETPGLGARISEDWFKSQFRGKRGPFTTVPEGTPTRNDEFDAITGATITSTAVRDILNRTVSDAGTILKEQKQGE